MKSDLLARLTAAAPITALVSDRVSWFWRSQGDAVPAITLTLISPGEDWDHGGPDGLPGPRVQFDLWTATWLQLEALEAAVKAEMRAVREAGDTRFHEGFLEGEQTIAEGDQDGGEQLLRLKLDYMFYHEEI